MTKYYILLAFTAVFGITAFIMPYVTDSLGWGHALVQVMFYALAYLMYRESEKEKAENG